MSLIPKIPTPSYEITLPISGLKFRYRPYLVGEQKILLTALESGDEKEMVHAIAQMMASCIEDSKIVVSDLPLTDFEFLFLRMRCVSVGEFTESKYRCLHEINGEECNNIVTIPLNLNEIKIEPLKPKANIIKLNDTPLIGVCLNYPSYELMEKYEGKFNFEKTLDMIKDCISYIYDETNVYTKSTYSIEELNEWVDDLNQESFDKILKFFADIPTLKKDLNFVCKKCGHKEIVHLNGVQSFFV